MEELLSDTVVQSSEFILDSYAPSRTKCRVILLLIYIYIAGFDSISDLVAWGSFLKIGFGHPLLPTPLLWSFVWGLFALAGLALAMMSTSHEIMRLFHLKGSFCRSHVKLIPVAGLLLEDVPMLVMASLYGLSQYTCSTGSIMASSNALVPILISSVGTALATFWRLMLTLLHFRGQGQKKIRRRETTRLVNSPVFNRDLSNSDKTGSSLTPGVSDMTTRAPNGENRTSTKAVGTLAVEMRTPKGRHSNTNCSGLSTSRCSLKWWLQNCYKVLIFLFGLALCVLSILVVVGVIYLMVEQNPLLVHQPSDPLMIFTSSNSAPWPHPLVNISNVIDNYRVTLMYESRCQLVFKYQAKQHRIVYNFADMNVIEESTEAKRSSSEREKHNEREKGEWCEERLSNLFYGSYRDRENGGSDVEVFHELCLAVHLVLPPVTAEPVRDPGLA